MGFALWHQPPLLLCSGTHEYRPMGTAIIGDQGIFDPRDFIARRSPPRRDKDGFVGYFASLNDVNRYLVRDNRKHTNRRNSHRILATIP